ncbi:hypothetical protein RIF29_17272 [Crotalaria pallida]|uniref:Uncharacterized protein n=1 Tax=Crotalaria pallida TaxID=3830 RepID=A0AAN9FI43_CROPI
MHIIKTQGAAATRPVATARSVPTATAISPLPTANATSLHAHATLHDPGCEQPHDFGHESASHGARADNSSNM